MANFDPERAKLWIGICSSLAALVIHNLQEILKLYRSFRHSLQKKRVKPCKQRQSGTAQRNTHSTKRKK